MISVVFNFAEPAVYWQGDADFPCRVFLDTGWQDDIRGYESQVAHFVTLISVQLSDIPKPSKGDRICIKDTVYTVSSVQAQDDMVAVLNVIQHD